jgi:DNA helicase-2/ATP-dependent DNA helicase PcrA
MSTPSRDARQSGPLDSAAARFESPQLDPTAALAEPEFLATSSSFLALPGRTGLLRRYQRYAGQRRRAEAERHLDADTLAERKETVAREREIARAYQASENCCARRSSSFGSLITGAVEPLERDAALRATLQNRYRYILVDEFQDTNIAQLRLLELLTSDHRNILAVGDNDQAIYRFRGASFGSFKLFLDRFAGWREGDDSAPFRVSLTENYRSTPNILRVASQVIGMNTMSVDFPKKVLTTSRPEGEKDSHRRTPEVEDEARWVAGEIERIHRAGRRWRDFAVLYRAHNHRDALVRELSRRKIPFVISRLSILEHPLVKDLIAYLRLIAKPYDDIAAARVLAAPAWRLTPPELVRFAQRARKNRKKIYDELQTKQPSLPFEPSANELTELLDFLSAQRKTIHQRTAAEILAELLEWLEIYAHASEQDRAYVKRLPEFVKAWEPKSETRGFA